LYYPRGNIRMITFGIVIATYYRRDKKTQQYLERCLLSIKNQTYSHYRIYLIGDDYEKPEELFAFRALFPPEKIHVENLPVALERSRYSGTILWCIGGANAVNTGMKRLEEEGLTYYVHMDHDDYWERRHLETLAKAYSDFPGADFVYTQSRVFQSDQYTPMEIMEPKINNLIPRGGNVIHSSVSFRLDKISHRHRNTWETLHIAKATDADLWDRIAIDIENGRNTALYIASPTVFYDQENQNPGRFALISRLRNYLDLVILHK
jgi:glycosyltransferase involved in cell wall biosynthesis